MFRVETGVSANPLRGEVFSDDLRDSSGVIESEFLDDRCVKVEDSDASDDRFESREEVVDRLLGSEPTESLLIKMYLASSS